MNRDKIGTQTCYVHQHTFVGTLIYIAGLCLCHVCAIPVLHFKCFIDLYSVPTETKHDVPDVLMFLHICSLSNSTQ